MFSKKFLNFIQIWQNAFGIARTIDENICVDAKNNPIPWYTYPAIEYLNQFDFSGKKIFEYGCGNSTLYWKSKAQKVVSIEDKPEWFDVWAEKFKDVSADIRFRESGSIYERAVFEDDEKYDVIIIDGIRRAECAAASIKALNTGGIIMLDDSDRGNRSPEYQKAVATLKSAGLLQIDFYGFCPTNIYPKATSIFFSRDFNFPLLSRYQPANGIGNLWALSRKQRKMSYKKQISCDEGESDDIDKIQKR